MNKILLIFIILIFTACGGGGVNPVSNIDDNTTTPTTNISLSNEQWYLNREDTLYARYSINRNAHVNLNPNSTLTGRTIKVAVIDDGFDVNHPEIKDKIIATVAVATNGDILGNDVSHDGDDFHGTAVTGILASAKNNIGINGIAPNVELILIKYPENFTDTSEIEVFNQALAFGADIINCSWGTNSVSDVVKDYINSIATTARNGKGVLIVFAAGNENQLIQNDESSIEGVIAVGATGKDNLRTNYSDFGKELDVVAPGGESIGITTIDPLNAFGVSDDEYIRIDQRENNRFVFFIGTSASTPLVSGMLALGLEKNSTLTRQQIQNILPISVDQIGLNAPYLDKVITSSSQTPTVTGVLGSNEFSDFQVRFTLESNNTSYGLFPITIVDNNLTNSTFFSTSTEVLPEGNYTVELADINSSIIWATIENFEVNTSKTTETNTSIKKSDFYGHGKINVEKFLDNISF